MVSDEEVNIVVNESRGKFSRQIETYLDSEKSLHELFNEATGEDLARVDIEKALIKFQMQGIEEASELLPDSKQYLMLYFLVFIAESIINKKRLKSVDAVCAHRFSQTEQAIRGLKSNELYEFYSFIKSDFSGGEYSQMTDSFRDINRNVEKYTGDFDYLESSEFKEDEIRDLKKILDDCIKYLDSSIHLINSLASVLQGDNIDEEKASNMSLNNKTKYLKGTPIDFIFKTYNTVIRNGIKHGGDEVRYTEEKVVFTSEDNTAELNYKEFATYVSYFLGTVFCIHAIVSITHSEAISRKYQIEFYQSKFKDIEKIRDKI